MKKKSQMLSGTVAKISLYNNISILGFDFRSRNRL